ncbi:hypothetical protein [Streptomyces malaysiensis]|uniref:hypothetical protein n=1 Tax=Streptomyces malaysiensis TaxID=92644 RepID=UPI002B2D7FF7|nr:hypothetical protein R8789_46320 [Streptomyces malaysiensis]
MNYLTSKVERLYYGTALKRGRPIDAGIIESLPPLGRRPAWTSPAPAGAAPAPKPQLKPHAVCANGELEAYGA